MARQMPSPKASATARPEVPIEPAKYERIIQGNPEAAAQRWLAIVDYGPHTSESMEMKLSATCAEDAQDQAEAWARKQGIRQATIRVSALR